MASVWSCFLVETKREGLPITLTIGNEPIPYEEIHEVDHHEKLVFLGILQNLEKCLENVLVLVLMEILVGGASWSIEVDTEESAKTTALGVAAS
ncbi:hypothetical protein Tco_0641286 [Tanacetum coccineum]